jgi:flagellar hook capping protein FlgD
MYPISKGSSAGAVLVLAMLCGLVAPRVTRAAWPPFGRALSTAPGDQLGPAIASDGAGGAVVVWHDRRNFPFNIDAQHVLASGEVDAVWPINGRALLTDALVQTIVPQGVEFPVIVSDGTGGVIATWPDGRSTLNGLDIYAHHVLASGVLDGSWPVNGVTVCSVVGEQISPAIVSDGAGGAFIAWTDGRAGTSLDDRDVYAQHVLATGRVDPSWPANGTPVSTAPKAQTSPAIVADGAGGFIATWNDLRSGNPGIDIYAQRVLASGAVDPAWPVNGLGVCTAQGTQSGPMIISDGAHGAIITWTDSRDGTNEIFAQRVSSSGAFASGWPTDGRKVSVGGIDEVLPTLAPDGASGAIVAWGGGSSGHHNMHAQHLLASGVPDAAWPVGGTALSFASTEQTNQDVASDGAGGAIVAWQQGDEDRGFDIFAQHVVASGALDSAYPASGRAVCALPGLQHQPRIVAAGAGGAIVTWMDTRDGLHDIYALQVLAAGTVSVPGPTGPAEISFARPSPNPARMQVTLRFALPREARVRLVIHDAGGRRVRELASGAQPAGEHARVWDFRDDAGHVVGAGIYFARLETDGRSMTRKVATLK